MVKKINNKTFGIISNQQVDQKNNRNLNEKTPLNLVVNSESLIQSTTEVSYHAEWVEFILSKCIKDHDVAFAIYYFSLDLLGNRYLKSVITFSKEVSQDQNIIKKNIEKLFLELNKTVDSYLLKADISSTGSIVKEGLQNTLNEALEFASEYNPDSEGYNHFRNRTIKNSLSFKTSDLSKSVPPFSALVLLLILRKIKKEKPDIRTDKFKEFLLLINKEIDTPGIPPVSNIGASEGVRLYERTLLRSLKGNRFITFPVVDSSANDCITKISETFLGYFQLKDVHSKALVDALFSIFYSTPLNYEKKSEEKERYYFNHIGLWDLDFDNDQAYLVWAFNPNNSLLKGNSGLGDHPILIIFEDHS